MDAHLFWFDDDQWAKIEPHLPKVQPGPQRKDDRRILSGIMHVLKVGCRWVDCPKEGCGANFRTQCNETLGNIARLMLQERHSKFQALFCR